MTTESRTYNVPGVSCDHCKNAIEGELATVPGVTSSTVDVDAKVVTVHGGDDTAIREAIDEAGYDVA